ncbi:MAG: LacI family DNA-binding transcriptional regulator [Armatimonadota bacterium]
MAITLKDIAKAAGVSVTTVSLVLRENPHPMISEATREKVRAVARKLKYRHNPHARALRMGKNQEIGLLMFDLETRIALAKLEAVDQEVWERGYRTRIRNSAGHAELEPRFISEYAGGAVDGLVIVQPTQALTREMLEPLVDGGVPVVTLELIDGAMVDCVTIDRRHGAYTAVKHLIGLGHKRIGFLHATSAYLYVAPRFEGYKAALSEAGIEFDPSLLVAAVPTYKGGYDAARELLARKVEVSSIFFNNDEMAIGAMKAIREAGLRVPEDIAIIGFDNIEAGEYAPVPLTTIAQPVEELASKAVELLFSRLKGESDGGPKLIQVKPDLVIRESCGSGRE